MIKVENVEVWGFEHAIRGMRNPMNSWGKSDSRTCGFDTVIGLNDLDLMRRLFRAGTEHRKYLRQIFVSMDVTAPLYWWKENDQYKVGTVTNSCSTMHKIMDHAFTEDDFSFEVEDNEDIQDILTILNKHRNAYLDRKNKQDWYSVIKFLPEAYNQKRTLTMNYENVFTIIRQRSGHKLDEWNVFVSILKNLPYVREISE